MTPREFVSKTRSQLNPILDRSGWLLYSSFSTLKKGDFYTLGLNPGGGTEDTQTIRQCVDQLHEQKKNDYLEDDWGKGYSTDGKPNHPLQRHYRELFDLLNVDVRSVCASNLIFTRSRDQGGSGYPQIADLCWPVHQMIIDIVDPSILLVFGNSLSSPSPYRYLFDLHKSQRGVEPKEECVASGHGKWSCRSFVFDLQGRPRIVIGIPHLSRYSISGKKEASAWIKKKAMPR